MAADLLPDIELAPSCLTHLPILTTTETTSQTRTPTMSVVTLTESQGQPRSQHTSGKARCDFLPLVQAWGQFSPKWLWNSHLPVREAEGPPVHPSWGKRGKVGQCFPQPLHPLVASTSQRSKERRRGPRGALPALSLWPLLQAEPSLHC